MDINDFRALATVLVFLSFVSIVWWAYGPSRKTYFDQAAQLPFAADDENDVNKLAVAADVHKSRFPKGEQA